MNCPACGAHTCTHAIDEIQRASASACLQEERSYELRSKLAASESRERALREALEELCGILSRGEFDKSHPVYFGWPMERARAALSGSSPAPSGDHKPLACVGCGGAEFDARHQRRCRRCGTSHVTAWKYTAPAPSGDVHRDDGQGYRKEEDRG